jgi:hypothetical protein
MTGRYRQRMKDRTLRRFWIEFEPRLSFGSGFGVTAIDVDDALGLIAEWRRDFLSRDVDPLPPPMRIVEDVDVSTLDPGHVLNQINPPIWRGVWYPRSSLR